MAAVLCVVLLRPAPIVDAKFNQRGDLYAYAVSYDWSKVSQAPTNLSSCPRQAEAVAAASQCQVM